MFLSRLMSTPSENATDNADGNQRRSARSHDPISLRARTRSSDLNSRGFRITSLCFYGDQTILMSANTCRPKFINNFEGIGQFSGAAIAQSITLCPVFGRFLSRPPEFHNLEPC